MLLFKIGVLAIMGKKFYSGFLISNLIITSTESIKNKIHKKLRDVK
jgi:hypothetical protein